MPRAAAPTGSESRQVTPDRYLRLRRHADSDFSPPGVSDRHLYGWDRSAVRVPARDEWRRAAGSGSGSDSLAAPEGSVYLALRPPGGGRAASHMPRRRRATGRTAKTAQPLPSANCAVVMTIRGIGGQCAILRWRVGPIRTTRGWTPTNPARVIRRMRPGKSNSRRARKSGERPHRRVSTRATCRQCSGSGSATTAPDSDWPSTGA